MKAGRYLFGPLAALATAIVGPAQAEPHPASLREFVPAGWNSVLTLPGELTGDDYPDAVLLLQKTDPANRFRNNGLGAENLDANPRRLIVFAGSQMGFRQIASTDRLIPAQGSRGSPCLTDPLEDGEIRIVRRILHIRLQYWLSCGSYGVTNRSYKFRLDHGRLRLIGFDRLDFSRSSGLGDEVSIDFLAGKLKRTSNVTIVGDENGTRPKVQWSRVARQHLFLEDLAIADCNDLDPSPVWC